MLAANLAQSPSIADEWPSADLEAVKACPVCEETKRRTLYGELSDTIFFCSPGKWALHRCEGCESAYLDPRPTEQSIGRAYQTYYTHAEAPEAANPANTRVRLKRAVRNAYLNAQYGYRLKPSLFLGRWLIALIPPARTQVDRMVRHLQKGEATRLLDIGCGNGAFVRDARSWGWDAEGMDPDPNAAAAGRALGLKVTIGSLPKTSFPDASFDAVTMAHCIEHLHDPVGALREILRILKPGGTLWLTTPNVNSTGHAEFGTHWRGLEPPRHLVLFTSRSLAKGLARAGFNAIEQKRQAFCSRWFFTSSNRLRKGEDSYSPRSSSLPLRLEIKARIADWLAFLSPLHGEEILFTAKRPL